MRGIRQGIQSDAKIAYNFFSVNFGESTLFWRLVVFFQRCDGLSHGLLIHEAAVIKVNSLNMTGWSDIP